MINLFFHPIDPHLTSFDSSFAKQIKAHTKKFPDTKNIDVAIIGIDKDADSIREQLYQYSNKFDDLSIADFGNIKYNGKNNHLQAGLKECLIALNELNIKPLIIGGKHNISKAITESLNFHELDYSLVSPDISMDKNSILNLLIKNKKLFHASLIANQSFLVENDSMNDLNEEFVEYLRLGELRSNISVSEPLLRQSDVFEFNASAIKYNEFQAGINQLPNGLTNQEACALCRYAGISNSNSLYYFSGFNLSKQHPTNAKQLAQMIWYTLEGIDNRFNDHPKLKHPNFTVYKCHTQMDQDIVFIKSLQTERWWMQLPSINKKIAPKFIGCNESDFLSAQEGEVPEKWYRAIKN